MSASPRADEQALCGKRRPARALPLFVWSPDEAAALEVGRSIADSEGWTCLDGINLGSLASQLRALFDHVGDRQERDGSDVFDVVLDSVLQVAGTYWDANESTAVVVCPATDASEHPKVLLNACPMARVICVHRSCSGSIESLLERNRLGFQSVVVREYVKAHAGNLVHALALYWADVTERLLQLEHEEASRCCRCSYEGFRAEKESVASEIRKFVRGENAVLSVAPPAAAVAITASTLPMERVGPNVRRRIDRLNQLIGYDALDDDYCRHVDALLRTDILVSGVRVKLPGLGSGCEVASSAEIGDVDLVRGKLPDGLVAVVEAIVRRLDG